VELARIHYYTGRLEEAERILGELTAAELVSADAVTLLADVRRALAPPADPALEDPEPVAPPTLLELAIGAREDDDFERADSLFRAALDERPEDPDAWQAYADFLQYEMQDLAGALEALEAVERLTLGADPALQHRMALLEIWTDRLDAARARLEALLALLDARAARAGPVADTTAAAPAVVTKADVLALLGDLDRWSGARLGAVGRYEAALEEEPEHPSAREGLDLLRAEVDRLILETERPRLGAIASTLADTDDFVRVDLGGEWAGVRGDWVWSARAGNRWLEGVDLGGGLTDGQGLFTELEGGRWWRWGTVRTGAHLGVQTLRTDRTDPSLGASARLLGPSGRRTELRVDHEPAYGVTNTLQAVLADVRQDEVTVSHAQPLGERWSAAATAQAASLDHHGLDADRNLRLSGGASVGRGVASGLVVGVAARALRYMDAAPDATGVALYWDPELSLSVGPYAQYSRALGTWWEMSARLNPGVGWIEERGGALGAQTVPDLSATLGLAREGARYRSALELFYGQGRFSGYRSFGASLSFSVRGGSGGGT
jgi:tetratricopeptide (TPR) repeat protein